MRKPPRKDPPQPPAREPSATDRDALALATAPPPGGISLFEARPDLEDAVRSYVNKSEAANTKKARAADWRVFTEWCDRHGGLTTLPAETSTVAAFLADRSRAGRAVATVKRYARTISALHLRSGHGSPVKTEVVRALLRGMVRDRGTKQKQKEAFTAEVASRALAACATGHPLRDLRDRALILLGLTTAMRQSELCSLDVEDVAKTVSGEMFIRLRRSKTDQEGEGRVLAVPRLDEEPSYCPVRALEEWLEVVGTTGPLFRSMKRNNVPKTTRMCNTTVISIVKRVTAAAGFRPEDFGAHSLRAGYVTTARQNGVDWASIMEQTGHKQIETAKLYTRYKPEPHVATRVADVFRGAFKRRPK